MKVVILAGGKGTRISEYSKNIKHPIYSRYKKFNSNKMDENFFPILWSKGKNKRSNFLT